MTWALLIAGLAGAAGWLYGLWQRSRMQAERLRADGAEAQLRETLGAERNDAVRFEAVITGLRAEIARLETERDQSLDPASVRARLDGLLGGEAAGDPPAAAGVPARAAPERR